METNALNESREKLATSVEESIPVISAIRSIELEERLSKILPKDSPETTVDGGEQPSKNELINEYLTSNLSSGSETKIKKILAIAAVLANQKGTLHIPEEYNNAESYANSVDEAAARLKANYQVGSGRITASEALDYISDRLISRVTTAVDTVVDYVSGKAEKIVTTVKNTVIKFADNIVEKGLMAIQLLLKTAITKIYPPLAFIHPYIDNVIQWITPKAKQFVKKGVTWIADKAKTIINNAKVKVKEGARKVLTWISNKAKKMLS